jgi:hypothetical protein
MRKVSLIAVLAVVGSVAMSVPAFAGDWVANGSTWEYYENGSRTANRWVQGANSQTWYYIKGDCKMASNEWVLSNGAWYYMNSNGAMAVNQWVQSGGDWYYMGGNGVMVTNQNVGGYVLGSDGKMKTNNSNASTNSTQQSTSRNNKSEYSLSDLIGTYSGYVYYYGKKADARVSIYEDMSEVYAEIYYDDSDGDECGVRYRVSKDDNAFTFGGGTNITEAWGLFRLLNYEYTSVKFDGTRLKTKFSDNTYSFVVDKN